MLPASRVCSARCWRRSTGYKIGLFLHILAVVLAFGPTFGYALFFSVAPQYPRATPAILAGVQKCDRYLVNPGMIVLLLAGIYLLSTGMGDRASLHQPRLRRDHRALRPPARLLPAARCAKAKELAERDLKAGDTLSDEFMALRSGSAKSARWPGLIVVVAIFFMTYKPDVLLRRLDASRSRCSTPGSAGSRCCTSAWSRCPRRTSSTSATRRCSPTGRAIPTRLRERIRAIAELLLEDGAKLLVIACNTATSIGDDVVREVAAERGVEVVPVVEPQAEIAAAITDNGRVGVLATPNTVASGAYRRALEGQGRALEVTEVEAPDLAPFIQDGSPFDDGVMEMARAYCAPLKRAEVDTLILGCTHYPLVAPMLQRILGRDVRLVSGGHAVAAAAQRTLERRGLARESDGEGEYRFLCSGEVESFRELGTRFLQMPLGEVERIETAAADYPLTR